MSDDNRGPSVAAQIRRAPAWVRSQFTWKRALLIALWFAMLGVLVWVVCYGIAGRLAWGGVAFAVAVFVAYSLFLLITYVLPYLPRAGEWFVDHGVTYLTVIMMIILVVTLLTWWWVNFQWAAEDELTSEDHTALTIGGLVASGAYPAVALIAPDSADSDVLTLAVSSPPTTTLTTTLALTAVITPGMGLTFDRTPGVFSQEIDIEVKPGQTARDRAVIVNAETFAGLRTAGAINVSLRDAAGAELGALHLPVTVEGQRGFAVRSFVTSAVDEASPLIFLLLLVVPGLATLVQKAIDERTKRLNSQRQEEYRLLLEHFREEIRVSDLATAESILVGAGGRPGIKDRRFEQWNKEAKDIGSELLNFARLQFPNAPQHGNSKPEPKEEREASTSGNVQDRPVTRSLAPASQNSSAEQTVNAQTTAQATGRSEGDPNGGQSNTKRWPDRRILEISRRWPEEFAWAYVQARRSLRANNFSAYYHKPAQSNTDSSQADELPVGRGTPTNAPSNDKGEIARKLREFVQEARYALQYQEFLDNRLLDIELAAWAADQSDMNPVQPRPTLSEPDEVDYAVSVNLLAYPFTNDDARHPVEARFLKAGGFLGAEARVGKLRNLEKSVIVYGPPGSGRTALATMFPFRPGDPYQLPVKFDRQPSPTAFRSAIARQILRFIGLYPTKLAEYGPGQRALLARLVISHLGDFAIALIERDMIKVGSSPAGAFSGGLGRGDGPAYLDDLGRQEMARRQLEGFKRIALKERAILGTQSPTRTNRAATLKHDYEAFLEAADLLEFRGITFVYDDIIGDAQWLVRFVHDQSASRSVVQTRFCILTPDEHLLTLQSEIDPALCSLTGLTWNGRELKQMATWRLERYLKATGLQRSPEQRGGENPLLNCFQDYNSDVLALLLVNSKIGVTENDYNPRRFMRLWQLAAGRKRVSGKITSADVDNAVRMLKENG